MRRALPDAAAAAGTVLLALGAWLLVPRERAGVADGARALRVVLVDTSASAVWRRSEWPRLATDAVLREATRAESEGEDLAVVLYGSDVTRAHGPGSPREVLAEPERFLPFAGRTSLEVWTGAGRATRIAGALEIAAELVRARPRAEVVIVGDGTYTGEDPRAAIARLRGSGASVVRRDLPPADVPELVPGALRLPAEVEAGAPIAASFEVFYGPGGGNAAATRAIRVELGGHAARSIEIGVPRGQAPDADGYLVWTTRVDLGRAEAGWNRVTVRGSPGSAATSEGVVRGGEEALVAVVGAGGAWEAPGLDVVSLQAEELPPALDRCDAVVTVDLPLDELPVEVLRSFVRRGGGWLARLGEGSLSSFVAGVPALELLPLLPPEDDPVPRDVVFLVDRSGSMAGERSENVRRAVFALIDEALPGDAVSLRWFSERLSEPVRLLEPGGPRRPEDRAEARRRAADRVFATAIGGGPTALLGSLASLAEQLARAGREALVLLLTDGRENTDPDPAARAPEVLERLRAARARLVVIAAGEAADRSLLRLLVPPGEELREVGSLSDRSTGDAVRAIFRRELNRERWVEGEATRIVPGSPAGPGLEVLEAMKPSTAATWPSVSQRARARRAPDADVLWTSEDGDPLLALRREGRGLVAACAFPRGPGDPSELLLPLLRALARGRRASGAAAGPRAFVEGGRLHLEGLPADAPALLEGLCYAADARPGDGPLGTVALFPPSVGGDPRTRRVGGWPAELELEPSASGSARVPRVELRAAGEAPDSWDPVDVALPAPREPEFALPRPRLPPLPPPVGGEGEPAAGEVGRVAGQPPIAAWVLLSGMVLLAGAGIAGAFSRRHG